MSRTLSINLSLNARSSYNTRGVDSIKFEFPHDSVDFSREGNSLVISSNDGSGSQALLHNYFVENETNTLPTFELHDGTIVSGVNFLTDYEIDTAAGPSASTNGLNSYSDDAGELISGIDKLGILGGDSFLSANDNFSIETSSPVSSTSNANGNDNGGDDNGGDDNGGDDNGGDDNGGNDERFVFQPTSQITSEVTINVTNPSNEAIEVKSYNEEYIKNYEVKADGSILMELTDIGKDALAKGDKLIFDIAVSVGGEERGVEVIINSPKDFTSSDADKASGIVEGSIAYEHHIMHETYKGGEIHAGGTKQSDVTVTTSLEGVRDSIIEGNGHTTVDITSGTSGIKTNGVNEANTLSSLGYVDVEGGDIGISVDLGRTTIENVTGNVEITGIAKEGIYNKDGEVKISGVGKGDATDSEVSVTGGTTGIVTSNGGKTTIEDVTGKITVTGEGDKGIATTVGGKTTIKDVTGDVEVTGGPATTGSSRGANAGISTSNDGSETTIQEVTGNVTVEGGTEGIYAGRGGTTTITDITGNVTITGTEDSTGSADSIGIYNINPGTVEISGIKKDNSSTDPSGNVTITGAKAGIYGDGTNAKTSIKDVDSDVTITGGSRGISTNGRGQETTIEGVKGNVTVTGGAATGDKGYGSNTGISTTGTPDPNDSSSTGGKTTIKGVDGDITVAGVNQGIFSGAGATTTIEGFAGDVKITATSTTIPSTSSSTNPNQLSGIYSQNSTVKISGKAEDGSVIGKNVTVTGGVAGIFSEGASGTTTIENVSGVTVEGGTIGLVTNGSGAATTIEGVKGAVTVTGGETGISTSGGTTKITNVTGDVNITGKSASDSKSYGIFNQNGTVEISDIEKDVIVKGGTNGIFTKSGETTINNVGNVSITGVTAGIDSSYNNAKTTITNVKNVNITATGKGLDGAGIASINSSHVEIAHVGQNVIIDGSIKGVSSSREGSTTTIEDVAGKVIITGGTNSIYSDWGAETKVTANNIKLNGLVSAEKGGINTISSSESSAITLTITAKNAAGEPSADGMALSATGEKSTNIIQGHSTSGTSDHITIVGGISAKRDGVNIIETGSGENIITLDGKIYSAGSLEIHKGAGWNQLVLTADSPEQFKDRYGDWLDKIAKDPNFATEIGIDSIDISSPDKHLSFDDWLDQSGNASWFYDLIDALHNAATDADRDREFKVTYNGSEEDLWASLHPQTYAAASTTSLLTASVDDTHDSHSAAKAEDSQATNHTVASLDDSQTVAHSITNADDKTEAPSATLVDNSHIDAHVMELVDFTSIEDVHLSDADETVHLVGGQYSHILDMGGGNDTLSIVDTNLTDATLLMGEGNDRLILAGGIVLDHTTIDGGDGYDVLELGNLDALHSSNGTLDLSSLAESISGFEVIDLSGSSGMLHVDIDSLLGLGIDSADAVDYTLSTPAQSEDFDVHSLSADNTLVIKADSNESVSFDANWHDSGATVSDGGHEYSVYTTSYDESQYFILLQAGTMV